MQKIFNHHQQALIIVVLSLAIAAFRASAGEFDNVPAKGKPSLLILGTPSCPPCIRMKPILEKIATQYREKASVVPIDVSIYKDQMVRFNVKAIPVEIFFDADGREVYRHLGFMDENSILGQFKKIGLE